MGKRLGLLAGATLAVAATAATATATGPGKPFTARYHVSGYGVYHQTHTETYTAAPCQAGGKGGGTDGTRKQVTTIKWETVQPGTALVAQILPTLPPTMTMIPGPNVRGPGVIATATVTHSASGQLDNVLCHTDGSEERLGQPFDKECGTHTYAKGYIATPQWPVVENVSPNQGDHIAVTLEAFKKTSDRWATDWKHCWGPGVNAFGPQLASNGGDGKDNIAYGALPFAHLPRKIHGKVIAIARGHKSLQTDAQQGGSEGGHLHTQDQYGATNYVTFVRTG